MTDLSLALMSGIDIPIPELQLTVHQPTIKEISFIGHLDFFLGIQCLNINKNMIAQGETLLANTNNFQIFMTIMSNKETLDKKEAVIKIFEIIFPSMKCMFTPRSLIFQGENMITIDENNFDILQQTLAEVFCMKSDLNPNHNFNPANEKAKEIANKLMRGRERVAALKKETGNIFAQYVSILTVGIQSMSLQDCLNLTMYQLFDLMERYSLYVNWDMYTKAAMAGAKQDSKPDNWMKNIH